MSQHIALYGFVRRKDGLRVHPRGVDLSKCFLYHVGGETAAVVSIIRPEDFRSSLSNMVRHEEAVEAIFERQVILPVKFPRMLTLGALKRAFFDLDGELGRSLRRMVYKAEYHVRVMMFDGGGHPESTPELFNAFSRYIFENSGQYRYKHYFPVLTYEAKEAEFLQYAEGVVAHLSRSLTNQAVFWRQRTFSTDKVLLDSIFWIRRHRAPHFLNEVRTLRRFYPNLKISVLGPRPPYNFSRISLKDRV